MPQPDAKTLVKFLRDEAVKALDRAGEQALETSRPSTQAMHAIDTAVAEYKNLLATGAVTLDILSRLEKAQGAKTRR